jgi:hypothetical protein
MKISAILDTMEQLFRMERQIPTKQTAIELALQELTDPECKGYKLTIGRQRVAAAEAEAKAHQAQMDELATTIPADTSLLLLCEYVAENRLKREDLVAAITKASTATTVAKEAKVGWRDRAAGAPSQQAIQAKQTLEKATLALQTFEKCVAPIETFVKQEQERESEREEYDAWLTSGMEGPTPALIKRTEAKWLAECLEGCDSIPIPKPTEASSKHRVRFSP